MYLEEQLKELIKIAPDLHNEMKRVADSNEKLLLFYKDNPHLTKPTGDSDATAQGGEETGQNGAGQTASNGAAESGDESGAQTANADKKESPESAKNPESSESPAKSDMTPQKFFEYVTNNLGRIRAREGGEELLKTLGDAIKKYCNFLGIEYLEDITQESIPIIEPALRAGFDAYFNTNDPSFTVFYALRGLTEDKTE